MKKLIIKKKKKVKVHQFKKRAGKASALAAAICLALSMGQMQVQEVQAGVIEAEMEIGIGDEAKVIEEEVKFYTDEEEGEFQEEMRIGIEDEVEVIEEEVKFGTDETDEEEGEFQEEMKIGLDGEEEEQEEQEIHRGEGVFEEEVKISLGGEEVVEEELDLWWDDEAEACPTPTAQPVSIPAASPTALPALSAKGSDGGDGELETYTLGAAHVQAIQKIDASEKMTSAVIATASPVSAPTKSPETTIVTGMSEDQKAQKEVLGETRKRAEGKVLVQSVVTFFKRPVVKVVTVTAGPLLAAVFLGIWVFVLRGTVKLYNDDGTGKMVYLGRCGVDREEDNFFMTITEEIEQKASSNRYLIRPGAFLIGRSREQELFVCKGEKRISVYLNRKMMVVI